MCHDTSFFVSARNTVPSSRHINTSSITFLPLFKTGSPLTRVAHRHVDPQCTAPPLASFQNAELHIAVKTVAWTFQSQSSTSLPTISMVFSWLCQNPNRSNSDKIQDIVHVHTDCKQWVHLLRRVNHCTRSRSCASRSAHSQFSHRRSKDNTIASERFITPHQLSTSPTIAPLPCVELWMFECAVVGCAVGRANVVSVADNRRKTSANMRMTLAGTLTTWASEPNGSTTHDV